MLIDAVLHSPIAALEVAFQIVNFRRVRYIGLGSPLIGSGWVRLVGLAVLIAVFEAVDGVDSLVEEKGNILGEIGHHLPSLFLQASI